MAPQIRVRCSLSVIISSQMEAPEPPKTLHSCAVSEPTQPLQDLDIPELMEEINNDDYESINNDEAMMDDYSAILN